MTQRFRQFRLINAVGAEYDLCDTDHFFSTPGGLGFQRNISSLQVGDSFAPVENKLNQQIITGEMRFRNYEEYSGFKEFASSGGLVLAYQPKGFIDVWYYRNVDVQRLDKTEIDHVSRRLICPVDFICFSLWYEKTNAQKTVDLTGENTVFPLEFPFMFCAAEKNELVLNNDRVSPAPCRIIISGAVVNPSWVLKQGGVTIASGAVNVTIASGEKLIVDSNVESMRIVKLTSSGAEVNVYQYSDFSTERFIFAPTGESRLKFSHSTSAALDVTVEVRQMSETI